MLRAILFLHLVFFGFAQTDNDMIIIGKKFKLFSKVLNEEKEIYISLPHKYHERVHKYPVVFVLEAEFLFEATHTISKFMSARSKMPQSIIVGLANGQYEKRREMDLEKWGGKPKDYLTFFRSELIPYIEKNYRANFHRTIIGLSPTNGVLFEALLNEADIFRGYIALSAHLEWTRKKGGPLLIDEIINTTGKNTYPKSALYLGRADSDLEEKQYIRKSFDDAKEKLKNSSLKIQYKLDVLQNEEHYLMSLAGIRAGFETIYPNSLWKNPGWLGWDKNENYALNYYKKYYGKLSKIYGFDIYPVEDGHAYGYYLTGQIYLATKRGTNKQVIDILELSISYYPNSANLHMMLAEAYKEKGENAHARLMANKSVTLIKKYNPDKLEEYIIKRNTLLQN